MSLQISLNKNLKIDVVKKYLNYIIRGYDFDRFKKDEKTQDATIFNISQIGELIKNITNETREKNSDIEWQMIKDLRNRIIHDYSGINLTNICYIINNDLKELRAKLKNIIKYQSGYVNIF